MRNLIEPAYNILLCRIGAGGFPRHLSVKTAPPDRSPPFPLLATSPDRGGTHACYVVVCVNFPFVTAKVEAQVQTTMPTTTNATAGKSDGKNAKVKDSSVNDKSTDAKAEIRNKYNKPQRGNDYLMVQGRVLLLRLEHPDWTIETDLIGMTDDAAVFKATVRNSDGRIVATGHGRATEGKTSNLGGRFIEKAETAAIGRALALAGFGTDDTLDDSDYLADSPVGKAA
jgi:hypothetical protein